MFERALLCTIDLYDEQVYQMTKTLMFCGIDGVIPRGPVTERFLEVLAC